jgi:hypothetical protein
MNNETTKTFHNLTISEILSFAQSSNLDDTQLGFRLVKRIALEEKLVRLGEESAELNDLREVTDAELTNLRN